MSRIDNEMRVSRSVLDRLIDYEPKQTQEPPKSRSASLQELRQSVRRDLEWLLNTRSLIHAENEGLEEARKSVAFFGLPDFTSVSGQNLGEQKKMAKLLETAIRNFEPRFLDLKISLTPLDKLDRQFKFHIEARLDLDPTPEPIAFDTVLRLGSGEFEVVER